MGILLDAKLLPLYRDREYRGWPSRAAPAVRCAGFAPLSLTLRVVGYLTETEFPSQPYLLAVKLAESRQSADRRRLIAGRPVEEEGGDQMWVAADDAELAAEFLPLVTPPPSGAGGCGRNRAES
jgi:hypothetical protein